MSSLNPSPLRYPGGKFKISRLIECLIEKSGIVAPVYIEPFAGGAGVALDLLFRGKVSSIVINDSDRAIYSVWRAILTETDAFLEKVVNADLSIEEWMKQQKIYLSSSHYSLDFAFATFFLNRTNHSGILTSGPIGGQKQEKWTLGVRYNKERLEKQIQEIGKHKKEIRLYGFDIFTFLKRMMSTTGENGFIYFDPPYYRKGKRLYKNYFTPQVHSKLCSLISNGIPQSWIVTYDNVPEIVNLYEKFPSLPFSLGYSLANNGRGKEIMFFKNEKLIPTLPELERVHLDAEFDYPHHMDAELKG